MLRISLAVAVVLLVASTASAYVEAPHSLGQICKESTNIVLVEVTKVNKDKNLIIFKKVKDLKGKHNEEIKHNIAKAGFHEREWKNIMAWAEEGKQAVFFHNGGASETCIGTYWYQCYKNGDWWGMSHAEPFLLRTFYGDVDKLATAVEDIQAGKEVIVTCLADGNKEQLHQRKGKLQRLKASLKRLDYNAKRDFVGWGGDGEEIVEEFKTTTLLAESADGWKYLPASEVKNAGDKWKAAAFEDADWRTGKAPIGYGEGEIANRKGTTISVKGEPFVFRRSFDMPAELLAAKGVIFRLNVASDDNATVWINGELADQDPADDHEFSYWSREVELPAKAFKPGKNLVAVYVKNKPGSSDLFFDMEVSAQTPLPKKDPKKPTVDKPKDPKEGTTTAKAFSSYDPKQPSALVVDKKTRTLIVPCMVAPRKLENLEKTYPIEVIATHPAPDGQKAHETVVVFKQVRPSEVHKALVELGLKPGKPALGEGAKATGPEVKISLEIPGPDGKPLRVALQDVLVDGKSGKALPALTWHFTGSAMKQPDPEKDEQVYGADLTGTLIALFPVTADTVFQTQLTLKDEPLWKLEIKKDVLPKEGTAIKLIIEVK